MTSMPDGYNVPFHILDHHYFFMILQGTLNLDIGDGKTYPLRPGAQLFAEDSSGKGHAAHCRARESRKVCLLLAVDLDDAALPLRRE